jgi:hypothetical protein
VLRNEWREPLRAQRDPVAGDSGRPRSNRDDHQQWRKQTWLGRFVSTYGWRAYALPVLVALTAVVVYQTVTGISTTEPVHDAGPIQGPPTIDPASTAIVGAPPKGMTQFDANLPTGILPDGGPYTEAGTKTWHIVPGAAPQVGEGTAKAFTYTVEVEDGIDTTAFGGDEAFARMVSETLVNPKSWTHNPQFAFTRIDSGQPDFRVSLTSPMTVRQPGLPRRPAPRLRQRGALGARRRTVPGRRRLLPAVPGQPRGRPRHRVSASRAVRRERRARARDDATDLLHQQR